MREKITYDRVADLSKTNDIRFVIDAHGCMIIERNAKERTCHGDLLYVLEPAGSFCRLRILKGACEVFHNGCQAKDGSVIHSGDFFRIENYSFFYRDHRLWMQNREDLLVQGISYENLPDRSTYPAFRRNTRIQRYADDAPVEVLDPPAMPVEQENNLVLRLLPSLGMLAAAGLMASRGGMAMLVFSGISAGTGVLTAIAGTLHAGRIHRKTLRERQKSYHRYLGEKREELDKIRELEYELLRNGYPDQEELLRRLYRFDPDLFERRKEDKDFLTVRLGTGTVKAKRQVHFKPHDTLEALDELSLLPEQICNEYMWLKEVPVVCDLKRTAVLGITGKEQDRYAFMRNLILDIALHHYHSDVKMIFISSGKHAPWLHWLRFLPHIFLDPQFVRAIASDEESRNRIFEYLYRELLRRREEGTDERKDPYLLIFFCDDMGFRVHPISRFLAEASGLGAVFVFFAGGRTELVQGCNQVIDIKTPETAVMTDAADSERRAYFSFAAVSEKKARDGAMFLAPVYTQEVSLDPKLTREYTLFQMLQVTRAEELIPYYTHAARTPSSLGHSLAAPVGIGRNGLVYLDIHDSAHGPHGLVAGTTGSGKSELLQTYILSMAVRYHPYEVGFLIIDYKGGGMAGPFAALPHLLGTITNIDGSQAARALRSIRAELLKRQRLFEKAQVNHIDRYMQLQGKVPPLPHLLIIIDEFAELKAAHPEFMEELVSAARIGRSLGVHLILATQKPSGQVSEQIWSNSRFRICLKVQDAADSKEVLKSPLAAEIREPGRAYLQVGNREIFELFQSAYSSGPADAEEQSRKDVSVYQISDTGKRTLISREGKTGSPKRREKEPGMTQMDAAVRRIIRHCEEQKIRKLPDVFCPDLPKEIPYQHRESICKGTGNGRTELTADLGWYDDPDHQCQEILSLDFSRKHVLIAGSARSGKTNLLKIIIRDLALRYPPDLLHIYIIDYASRELKCLEELPHIGGVICSSEQEKTQSLFRMLDTELEKRKTNLASEMLSKTSYPHILLIIDNLSALKELVFQDDQRLLTLCTEGLQAGIHVAAANPLASNIGIRYLSVFGEKIALHLNDTGEYHYLFDRPDNPPEDLPGKILLQRNGVFYHGQGYRTSEEDAGQIAADICRLYADTDKKGCPKPVPQMPELLTEKEMEQFCDSRPAGNDREDKPVVPAGLFLEDIRVCNLDLSLHGPLLIAGTSGSGCHNWIRWLDRYLHLQYSGRFQYYIADGICRRLGWMEDIQETAMYTADPENAGKLLLQIESILGERYQDLMHGDIAAYRIKTELLILLIDSAEALDNLSRRPETMEAWHRINGRYKSLQVCPIIMHADNTPVSFQAPEILRDLRDRKNCLFFGELKNFRIFDLPYTSAKQKSAGWKRGDAWYINGTDCAALRTPYVPGAVIPQG